MKYDTLTHNFALYVRERFIDKFYDDTNYIHPRSCGCRNMVIENESVLIAT